jgi:hypothetical protein
MLDDVFAIEDEIAESVAASLRGGVKGLRDDPRFKTLLARLK